MGWLYIQQKVNILAFCMAKVNLFLLNRNLRNQFNFYCFSFHCLINLVYNYLVSGVLNHFFIYYYYFFWQQLLKCP